MIHAKSTFFPQKNTKTCQNQVFSIETPRELITSEAGITLLDENVKYMLSDGQIKCTVFVRRYN